MTTFDCHEPSCESPSDCLQNDVCLSAPERNELARKSRVKSIIDDTRKLLREGK